ncbi:10794_t:CDS:1, partial [Dentiscutata heterogama]
KQTYSEFEFCNPHARKHYKREQYYWKKQTKLALAEAIKQIQKNKHLNIEFSTQTSAKMQ